MKSLLIRIALPICLFPFLFGCGEGAEGQQKATKADVMDTYLSQEHRFEIRGCQLFYNEQHVVLDSIETFERIFGSNYESAGSRQKFYIDKPVEFYLKLCYHSGEKPQTCIERLNILMSHKEGVRYDLSDSYDSIMSLRPALNGYILFDGVLVDANTKVEDLNRQLKANGKYTLGSSWGNKASQAIRYGSGCVPAYNCIDPCLTVVKLYYYEDNISGEPTTIQSFRYEY